MKILQIGCGTLGGWLLKEFVKSDEIKKITVYDGDIVHSKNIPRSIFELKDINKNKALVASQKFPKKVVGIPKNFENDIIRKPRNTVIIDVTDNVNFVYKKVDFKTFLCNKFLFIIKPSPEGWKGISKIETCNSNYTLSQIKASAGLIATLTIHNIIKNSENNVIQFPIINNLKIEKYDVNSKFPVFDSKILRINYQGYIKEFENSEIQKMSIKDIINEFKKDYELDCKIESLGDIIIYPRQINNTIQYDLIPVSILA